MKKTLQSFIKCRKSLLTITLMTTIFNSVNAATFTVTTTADAGVGSFRQAILDANSLAGIDNIIFSIGTGAQTITLLSSVNVTTPMYIDGTTQPGFSGTPLITVGGVSMFNINSVNTGTLSSLGFLSSTSSTAINVNNSSNWLFVNNSAIGMNIAFQMQGNNTTNTITANNFSGSANGINMNGGTNNGNTINNNNLSNCTQWALTYNLGTPASINSNTFTGSANALYLRGASNFTLSAPGSGGSNENVFGTSSISGRQIQVESCNGVNISGFNFSSQASAPLSSRSPFLISNTNNSLFSNNIATGVSMAMEIQSNNTTNTITANNFSGSANGINMNGGTNNGNTVNNNNLSNCTQWALTYNLGTPASINSNTFTGSANALYLRGANTFTLGSSNVFKNQTGTSISLESCSAVNVSNNAVNGTGGQGILVNQSNNCVINGNTTCGRTIGIIIQGSSNANTISNGSIVSCGTGIMLDNTAVNNTTITAVNLFNSTNISDAGANTIITGTTSTNSSPIISVNSGAICSGSSFTMSPSGALTYTYTGGSAIVSPTIAASYSVTGIDVNGCVSSVPAVSNVTVNVCSVAAALNFDGSNDQVNIPMNTAFQFGTGDFTFESWVNTSGVGTYVALGANSSGDYWLGVSNGKASVSISGTTCYGVTNINNGTWHHIAGVRNAGTLSIYVDGVLENSISNSLMASPTSSLGIGCFGNSSYNFIGLLDEIRMWNVARTQCQINTYKNCEIPTTATGLLANYHFNQGVDAGTNTSATSLVDASGNGYNGTLNNFALTGATSNWVAPGGVTSGSITPANLTPAVGSTVSNSVICSGNSTTLSGTGANTYSWTNSVINATAFTPTATATYTVTGTNTLTGCFNTAVSSVTVNALPTITVSSGAICAGDSYTITANGAVTYTSVPALAGPVVTPTVTTSYSITGTDANGCISATGVVSTVSVNAVPTITVNSGAVCPFSIFNMTPGGAVTYTYSNGSSFTFPLTNESYTVTGTDANGCANLVGAVSSVTVNALPTLSITTTNTLLCAGQGATLTVSGALMYAWSTSETTSTLSVSPSVQTSYTVDGTDGNGCVNTTTFTQDVSTCTGVNQLASIGAELSVYPNPSNGIFTIQVSSTYKVSIYDALGKVVYSEQLVEGRHLINLSNYANGLYVMKAEGNNQTNIFRLIKE